jgi:hypothetical protein
VSKYQDKGELREDVPCEVDWDDIPDHVFNFVINVRDEYPTEHRDGYLCAIDGDESVRIREADKPAAWVGTAEKAWAFVDDHPAGDYLKPVRVLMLIPEWDDPSFEVERGES